MLIKLAWDILRYKYWYYVESKPIISDYEYDQIEKEYERLCKAEGVPPTASDMVDFDWNRPACQLVAAKEQGIDLKMFQSGRIGASPPRKRRKK